MSLEKLSERIDTVERFTNPADRDALIRMACDDAGADAEAATIGRSESGREILGARVGQGARTVSLVAGAHADEPVGSETILWLVEQLCRNRRDPVVRGWLDAFTFYMIPHVNPDGEAANWPWVEKFPDIAAHLRHVQREQPGRDVEFGYPDMRVENEVASAWWRACGPFDVHFSLHGMSFGEGAMLLIERTIVEETAGLRAAYRAALIESGVGLHDHDRGGEKGFDYIEAGFQTTPEGRRMAAHFRERGDVQTAEKFHLSSMEYVRELDGGCRCFVTEVPLWRVTDGPEESVAGEPRNYLALRERKAELGKRVARGESIGDVVEAFGIEPVGVGTAMRLQVRALELACALV